MNERAGFVGLGTMGRRRWHDRFARAGFSVTACAYKRREAIDRLRSEGRRPSRRPIPAAVGRAVDIALRCVPDAPQVEEVLFGEQGLASGLRDAGIVVDCSTIPPIASRAFAARLMDSGIPLFGCAGQRRTRPAPRRAP